MFKKNIKDVNNFTDDLTPCDNVVCQNGGTCHVTSSTTYKCKCSFGFFGDLCENSKFTVTLMVRVQSTCNMISEE